MSDGFAATWLGLREPVDHRARSPALSGAFAARLGPNPLLLDLGCGAGSNLRYLAPRLPAGQRWRCVDHDPALLAAAASSLPPGLDPAAVAFEQRDLASGLAELALAPGMAVTGSALLDLASADWLDELAIRCRRLPVLFALSVDGRLAWTPTHAFDAAFAEAFWQHQRQDKGFGPALGPHAARHLARHLNTGGHRVSLARSDWRLGPSDAPLLTELLAGMQAAVAEVLGASDQLADWRATRAAELAAGRLQLQVGHLDLLALP